MGKSTLIKGVFTLLICYIAFFLLQHRKAFKVVFLEDHKKFRVNKNNKIGNEIWTKEREDSQYLEGYTTTNSISPGNTLEIFISTNQKNITGQVIRWGVQESPCSKSEIRGHFIQKLDKIGENRVLIPIKKHWKTGIYMVQLKAESGMSTNIIFIVRPKVLGSFSNSAVILATNTWQAYNSYPNNGRFPAGGFYRPTPYGTVDTITFDRPYNSSSKPGFAGLPYAFYNYVASLVHFLEKHHYRCEYLAEDDIWSKGLILPYKTLIFGDHTEYITLHEQENLVRFLNNGNNIIYTNGNPFYAQIHASGNNRNISLMWDGKNRDTSLYGNKKHIPFGRFYPESQITGVGFKINIKNVKEFFLPYTVVNPNHWVYKGTKLKKGNKFGSFGDERDVVNEYSPKNIEILAQAVWDKEKYIKSFIYNMPKKRQPLTYRIKQTVFDLSKIFIKQFIPSLNNTPSMLRTYMINPNFSDLISSQMIYYKNKSGGQVFSTGTGHWNWNMTPMDTLKEDVILKRILLNTLEHFNVPCDKANSDENK